MSCADYEALLCDYVDGNLTEADRLLVERHLASCPTCAANARDAAAALAFLRRAPEPEPPVHLVNTILFNIPVPGLPPTAPCSPLVARLTARLRPFLQPRFAMGMAMTILSFSMLARFAGIGPRQIHPQ
ncbi:MAG: zf-HC2 domain-containing protein, partial [Bryobacteraceae bacterium]|nr:zf-HC2 domain-containing protein [Bryobacteraceae bacterium]